jgi:Ca2+-binding EF-hand superfamily protein
VKQLQQQVLDVQAQVEHERQLRTQESDHFFRRLGDLKLRDAQVLDALADHSSPADVIQHVFDQLDVENRGALSIDELTEALLSLMPVPVSPDDYRLLTEAFAKLDPENTGFIGIEQIKQSFSDPTLSFADNVGEYGRSESGIDRLSPGGSSDSRRKESANSMASIDGEPSDYIAELQAQVEQYRKEKAEWDETRKRLESDLKAARLKAKETSTEAAKTEAEATPRTSPRSNVLSQKMSNVVFQVQEKRKKQPEQVVSMMAKKKVHMIQSLSFWHT